VIDGRRPRTAALAALMALTVSGSAGAQGMEPAAPSRPPGWSVTPSIGVSQFWDDNPTLGAEGDVQPTDFVTAVRPTLLLGYRGRRTTLRTDYGGSFDYYRDLSAQNTQDHRAGLDFTHQLTRRVQLFVRDHAMLSPTTGDALDALDTGGADAGATVLRRQETRMNAFRTGVESVLSKHTTLNLTYATQWIDFARDVDAEIALRPDANLLQGGHSHGGTAEFRHRLSQRWALGADYDVQRAIVGGGAETFDVQSALAVAQLALSPSLSASMGYGHAWLTAGRDGFSDSGPAFDLGLDWQGRRTGATLHYGRSFLPSFGFGGTFQNEELRATLRTSLSRYLQWTGGVAVSNNDPLEPGDPTLRAVSAQTSLGWLVGRRLRLEVFGQHVSQDSGLAGGRVLRTRAGVQAAISQTVRASR
jgi:hypothetical protein